MSASQEGSCGAGCAAAIVLVPVGLWVCIALMKAGAPDPVAALAFLLVAVGGTAYAAYDADSKHGAPPRWPELERQAASQRRTGLRVPDAIVAELGAAVGDRPGARRLAAAATRLRLQRRQGTLEEWREALGLEPPPPPAGTPQGPVPAGRQVVPISADQFCPFCREPIGDGQPLTSCAACRTVLHKDCLAELGGCPTQGCRNNPRDRRRV
ncbi:MAG: hypothetical protein AB7N76_21105 [Planctomycetota bacterium]